METPTRLPGTTYDPKRGKWKAQLRLDGKLKALGYYATQQEAASAVAAARELHGTPARGVGSYQRRQELSTNQQAVIKHNLAKTRVYQSNDLIQQWLAHPLKQNDTEFRLFMRMLQCLHLHDEVMPNIDVPIHSFLNVVGGTDVKAVEKACQRIANRLLRLSAPDGHEESFLFIPLVSCLGYRHSTRTVVGRFNEDLRHHLTKLKGLYTNADVETLMSLEGVNAQRAYWLFKMWAGLPAPVTNVDVDELRILTTGAGTYGMYNDFKRVVLLPVILQLKRKGFAIEMSENKQRGSVVSLDFNVTFTEPTKPAATEVTKVEDKILAVVAAAPDRRIVPVQAVAPVAAEAFLVGLSPQLVLAYEKMLSVDQVSKSVARKIISLVADSETKQKILFKARNEVAGDKLSNFRPGYTRAIHIVKAMKTIGLVLEETPLP